jgi:phosphatidylethanolamine/phosphatidyl-N-methylethanolamine N-methyltransferase
MRLACGSNCLPQWPAHAIADHLYFFRSWILDPKHVAAVAPSGKALARLMTMDLYLEDGPVLELGPGTGVFTQALLKQGFAETDLTLVEYGSEFAVRLQRRFPGARVLWMDAAQINKNDIFRDVRFGAVVSGLPLLSMHHRKILAILSGAFSTMRTNAAFYQFTYGPRCPVPRPILDRLGLKARRIHVVLSNVPPATVYKITRRQPFRGTKLSIHRDGSRADGNNEYETQLNEF